MRGKLVPALGVILIAAGLALAYVLVRGVFRGPNPSTLIPKSVATATPPKAASPASSSTVTAGLPWSVPVHLTIPAIRVSAPVTVVGLQRGSVGVPPLANHNLTAWFDQTVTPGENGPSFIDGHVDSATGISVFFYLKDLRKGDAITVTRADGRAVTFHVTWVQVVSKAAFPWKTVLATTSYPTLRLATCGGPYDYQAGHYLDNIIAYAS